jgi:hypothetical protein
MLRASRGAVLGLWPGLSIGVLWILAGKMLWVSDPIPALWGPLVGVVAGAVVLGAAIAATRPLPGAEDLALLLDRLLGTDEAAATAVGLGIGASNALVDALRTRVEEIDPSDPRIADGLPFGPPRRSRLLPLLLILAIGAAFLPPLRAPNRRAPSNDPDAEASRLVDRKEALERELGVELPEGVDRAFDDLIAALRSGEAGKEEAKKKAERLDEALDAMKQGSGDGIAGEMDQAKEALQDVDAQAAQDLEDATKDGDLGAAADAVERMRERMKKKPPQEQKKAADALKKAAEAASRAGAEGLADALKKEAQRANGGGDGGGQQKSGSEGSKPGTEESPEQGASGESKEESDGSDSTSGDPPPGAFGGLAEYLRELEKQGVGSQLGDAQTRREMANRLHGALESAAANPYEAGQGQPGEGRGQGKGKGNWGAGTSHTDEDQGSVPEGGEHALMNRQVDGVHRDWLTEYGQDHAEKRLEGIKAITETVAVPIGEGTVDVEFMRRTGSNETSGKALVQAPEGYRAAAEEAIDGEGVPRIYREQVKTYFDAIE